MNCKNCNCELKEGTKFCHSCGASVDETVVINEQPTEIYSNNNYTNSYENNQSYYNNQNYSNNQHNNTYTEDDLPVEYKPIGAWQYFGLSILFSLPLVGFILLIVFSFSNGNINRRNYARSYWCAALVSLILIILTVIVCLILGAAGAIAFEQAIADSGAMIY